VILEASLLVGIGPFNLFQLRSLKIHARSSSNILNLHDYKASGPTSNCIRKIIRKDILNDNIDSKCSRKIVAG
jgi:hypothetical protein